MSLTNPPGNASPGSTCAISGARGANKPASTLRVKVVLCASGERLPLLIRRDDGLPVFLPNVFAISQVRARSRASNTIERCLRAVAFLLSFADQEGIDLQERVESGVLLEPNELDRLADAAKHRADDFSVPARQRRGRLMSVHARVADNTAAVRLQYIREYLAWLTSRRMSQLRQRGRELAEYHASRDLLLSGLRSRIPSVRRYANDPPMGLAHDGEAALLAALDPGSDSNPWKNRDTRLRNQLLVLWLLRTGMRIGELLAVRLDDVNFRLSEVEIVRRHDSPDDPRRRQPVVKTSGRALPIDAIGTMTEEYIFDVRHRIPGARRHPFLFVASRSGRPLSRSAVAKIFSQLPEHPSMKQPVHPHVLRHTWNDRFSEAMDAREMDEATEERMRTYLQGWKPGSRTAATYTRRHVRERAKQVSSDLQCAFVRRGEHER